MFKRFLLTLSSCLIGAVGASAVSSDYDPSVFIKTDINSGNPNIPFPQFREYKHGKNLATDNAEGVTHADMEKAMREAYQMMTHRCRYDSVTVGGVRYITYSREDVPGGGAVVCSEGDGFALLASAIFADQPTFNGLYMWIHDNRMGQVKRFKDGKYLFDKANMVVPYLPGWDMTDASERYSSSSLAADGDIAMALLIAYHQWGDVMMNNGEVVKDSEGEPISLLNEANSVIAAMADTLTNNSGDFPYFLSGDIGLDGYAKSGSAVSELSAWTRSKDDDLGIDYGIKGLVGRSGSQYVDEYSPAYYDEFYRWFSEGKGKESSRSTEWVRSQFRRATASSNWLNKQAYDKGLYPSIGRLSMSEDNVPSFEIFSSSEDFRYPWRNMLDYIWHGNNSFDWDPVTHKVIDGENTSQYDMGMRYASILKFPLDEDGNVRCSYVGAVPYNGDPNWQGVCQNPQYVTMYGLPDSYSFFGTNFAIGAGAVSAVISEDHDLIADIYRQCEIMWEDSRISYDISEEERYEGSTPRYFHDWFRLLGMLTCSGNMIAPSEMEKASNVKVYLSTDKTAAYVGDTVTYTVLVRNYGAADASNVTVKTDIDNNFKVINVSDKNSSVASNVLTWNIKTLPGFKSGKQEESIETMSFKVVVTDTLNKHIALKSIAYVGGEEVWSSNEYPNNATYTMERNIVDVVSSPISVEKNLLKVDSNNTDRVVEVKICNNMNSEWLDGGRDNVRVSYAEYSLDNLPLYNHFKFFRFWHDAQEAYINLGNYRMTYFVKDSLLFDGLTVRLDNYDDLEKYGWVPNGKDNISEIRTLNSDLHCISMKLNDVLSSPASHLYNYRDSKFAIHKGGFAPIFFRFQLLNNSLNVDDKNDWSYSQDAKASSVSPENESLTLVSPSWANLDDKGYLVDNYSRNICGDAPEKFVDNILVEEFDGYTWRRVLGNAPANGKVLNNVVYTDTIPSSLNFEGFIGDHEGVDFIANKDGKNGGVVVWTCDTMMVGAEKSIKYQVSPAVSGKINVDIKSTVSANGLPDQQSKVNVEMSGVNSGVVSVNSDDTLVDVVSTSGVVLRKSVEKKSALKGLPVGVYVVGSEKVVKTSAYK